MPKKQRNKWCQFRTLIHLISLGITAFLNPSPTPTSVLFSPPQLLSTLEELYVEVDAQLSTVEGLLGPGDAMVSRPLDLQPHCTSFKALVGSKWSLRVTKQGHQDIDPRRYPYQWDWILVSLKLVNAVQVLELGISISHNIQEILQQHLNPFSYLLAIVMNSVLVLECSCNKLCPTHLSGLAHMYKLVDCVH